MQILLEGLVKTLTEGKGAILETLLQILADISGLNIDTYHAYMIEAGLLHQLDRILKGLCQRAATNAIVILYNIMTVNIYTIETALEATLIFDQIVELVWKYYEDEIFVKEVLELFAYIMSLMGRRTVGAFFSKADNMDFVYGLIY